MGTRGFVGFVVDGVEKITYNHFDSYPDGVGIDVLEFLHTYPELLAKARDLRVVDEDSKPTKADIKALEQYTDLHVSDQSTDDWYCLLRMTQGEPKLMLEAGIITDGHEFPLDSLFCEWGYLIDLDTMTFEVYKGFQHARHELGRFAQRESTKYPSREYFPVALAASWPLAKLPTNEQFLAEFKEDDE